MMTTLTTQQVKIIMKNRSKLLAISSKLIKKSSSALLFFVSATTLSLNVSANNSTATVHKAYVYTELQISVPFEKAPWQRINKVIKNQPGFINKTWLSGLGNQSAGGFYTFDSIENAQKFVTNYFPSEAKELGVALTTRVFDALATEAASREMNSIHYGGKLAKAPEAFVYTEVQAHAIPFNVVVPWMKRNPDLKSQPGFLAKTWLSGIHTGTVGGLYAFDTIENAKKFTLEYFPAIAKNMNKAFYTRIFDARKTEAASRDMYSPFYN